MKIYKEKTVGKKWEIELKDEGICLCAVDSETGEFLATLIRFFDDGDIVTCVGVDDMLEKKGYNPTEHGNVFNTIGCIKIKEGIKT